MTALPPKQETGGVQTRAAEHPAKARFRPGFLQDAVAQPGFHGLRLCLSAGEKGTEATAIPRVRHDRHLRGTAGRTTDARLWALTVGQSLPKPVTQPCIPSELGLCLGTPVHPGLTVFFTGEFHCTLLMAENALKHNTHITRK